LPHKIPRERYPWWVKVSLWGLPNKASVWAFVCLSLICAVGCVVYASTAGNPRWYAGLLFLLAALIYWLSIRWVDSNGSWDRDDPQ
jgi:predicted transporter